MDIEKFFWVASQFLVLNLLALVLGLAIGRKRRIGFFWTYTLSVFVNPVIGFLAFASPKKGAYPVSKPIEKPLGIVIGAGCAIASIVFFGQALGLYPQSGISPELLGRLYGTVGFGLSSIYWFRRYPRNEQLQGQTVVSVNAEREFQ